ncbi:MAG: BspA family leucine-rich repeat surface protein [Clostridiales bacterium]|nr:BspA family leucine-rich repeat surface protein [Candidatus Apopatousia equi]
MVKTKNKVFSIALCLILCLAMVLGGIKIASGRKGVSAEGRIMLPSNLYSQFYRASKIELLRNAEHLIFAGLEQGHNGDKITGVWEQGPDIYWDFDTKTLTFYSESVIYVQESCECLFEYDSTDLRVQSIEFYNFDVTGIVQNGYGMYSMFGGQSLITNLDLSMFNTSGLTSTDNMFCGCTNLETIDLSSFNFDKIEYYDDMFTDCDSLQTIYASSDNIDILKEIVVSFGFSPDIVQLKTTDPVEETGVDLYGALAISGLMLVLACGCAVALSKMKRKQTF